MIDLPKAKQWEDVEEGESPAIGVGDGFVDYLVPLMFEPEEDAYTLISCTKVIRGRFAAPSLILTCPGLCGHLRCGGRLDVSLN